MKGPIKNIPKDLLKEYTMNNQIPVYNYWFDESSNKTITWPNDLINTIKIHYTREKIMNNSHKILSIWKDRGEPYPDHRIGGACLLLQQSFNKYPIANQKIAVVGSTKPWIECICLNNESSSVTTVEYNVPKCQDDRINMMNYYNDFKDKNGNFDSIISYSSIEHSGLGRYGDILDPDGDLKAMKDIYNNLKEDGLLYLGIPVGPDGLSWNANRIYGKIRLPLLLEKFEILEWFGCTFEKALKLPKGHDWKSNYQPVIVLKKKN